ncbi:LamG-like jellyroll fold domain-containing protein [Nonomuraea spiralis]|uniref:LamG-like jellyroll fold domain-containing protein n=1 Tax=Nonomuraea spiralis TaxID=46182 RepID=A0ABV5IVM9_9ACTN|nr:LamG-like jellyroll fold domain-containing protein [Nonomuraea spiralis]
MAAGDAMVKVYGDRAYKYTAMVRHQGSTVAFAMDAARRIVYNVLNLAKQDPAKGELDAAYWADNPAELPFPREITEVGYAIAGATMMPTVKRGGRIEAGKDEQLEPEEIDSFLSTTARLSAVAPFQVLSDGSYVIVLRQSIGDGHGDSVFKLTGGGCSADAARKDYVLSGAKQVPLVRDTLLVDRFLLVDGKLKPVLEVRYRRSRHSTKPESAKDTLGTEDMEGRPFYEPTRELSFIRNLKEGRFTAVHVPTATNEMWRWQVFAHNDATGRVDSFNVERGADGWFNTQGTRFYTSPDAKYRDAVFERSPGTCPFTNRELVPVAGATGHAETALLFDGKAGRVDLGSPAALTFGAGPYTIEAWIKPAAHDGLVLGKGVACQFGTRQDGTLFLAHDAVPFSVATTDTVTLNEYSHVAAVFDGADATVYINGRPSATVRLPYRAGKATQVLIGATDTGGQPSKLFNGEIDEVRIWDRARPVAELKRDLDHRLIGNEPGLVAYYRLDEGLGAVVHDQSDNGLHGTAYLPVWVASQAPVGDHPGVRRDSFTVKGRNVTSGLASVVYHRQQSTTTGYGTAPKPVKMHTRVLLAFATKATGDKEAQVATLDFGVGRDGRLTQVNDVLDLPVLQRPLASQDLDAISVLEQRVASLEAEILSLPRDIDALRADAANVPAFTADRDRLARDVKSIQSTIDRLQDKLTSWRYRLRFNSSRETWQELYITVRGDSLDNEAPLSKVVDASSRSGLWVFEETGETHNGRTVYFIKNVLSGKDMNVQGDSGTDGTAIIQYQRIFKASCQFYLVPDGDWVRIFARHTNYAISSALGRVSQMKAATIMEFGQIKMIRSGMVDGWEERLKDVQHQLQKAQAALDAALRAQTRIDELTRRLAAKQAELTKVSAQLAAMTGATKGDPDLTVNLPLLDLDRTGLSCSGALLGFARCTDAPTLLDSANGNVVLYYRGANDQFFAAYLDTQVKPSVQELVSGGGAVLFTAKDAAIDLGSFTITVTDGEAPSRCDLTITAGNETEVWKSLPRDTARMAAILAGTAAEPVKLGLITTAARDTMTLAEPLAVDVPERAHLMIGTGTGFRAASPHAVGEKSLTLTSSGGAIRFPGQVFLIAYDYDQATCSRQGATLSSGSRLLTLTPGSITSMPNGKARKLVTGHGSRWRGEMPGRTYSFDGRQQHLRLPATQLDRVTTTGDLTMEAWVHAAPMSGRARILNANAGGSQYMLALSEAPRMTARVFKGAPEDAYELSDSIDLAGRDFTIEMWVRRTTTRAVVEPLLVHGEMGGAQNRTLHLQITSDNSFGFCLYGDDLHSPASAPDLNWHHWAAVYEHATRTQIIYRDGVEVARRFSKAPYSGKGPMRLGVRNFSTEYLSGEIDEVRLFGRARTEAEITIERNQRLSGREPGLLGYWTFPGPSAVQSPIKGHQVLAGVGNRILRSRDVFPCGEWAHLAAGFEQSWGIRFSGGAYLEVDKDEALDLPEDLTIEAFLKVDRLGQRMGLISKGETEMGIGVPYQLCVREDGKLEFSFVEPDGKVVRFTSNRAIGANAFHRIAVVRQGRQVAVSSVAQTADAQPWADIRFYIDGQGAGAERYTGPGAQGNSGGLTIGLARDAGKVSALSGSLGEVRLWRVARKDAQIGQAVTGHDKGLVARWGFEENTGNVTFDDGNTYPARLRRATWTVDPDQNASRLRVYRNGELITCDPATGVGDYGDQQLTLAARLSGGTVSEPFGGKLEEVRIWRTVRTSEQILDSLFTRLQGDKQDLIAYWPFDRDSTTDASKQIRDEGLRGNSLDFPASRPTLMLSNAPISTDSSQVRSALAAIRTPFHDTITSSPAVGEYADAQRTAKGVSFGVLKRCYGYLRDGRWHLVTGYKVGSLVSEWVGQVQFDPQLIGYIESAPPVPSENLTGADSWAGASSVEFNEANQVVYSLSSNRTSSVDFAFNLALSVNNAENLLAITAPGGMGTATPIAKVTHTGNFKFGLEFSNAWSSEAKVSQGLNTTRAAKLRLTGHLEDATKVLNSAVGRRYVPANMGYALVQSETADVFALRLAHTGALVAYRMLANPDIPKDWNIISFPVNPRYTKQGTLDGAVGFNDRGKVCDPDYPTAVDYGQYSFFKPREAYALKRRITREQERLRAYYEGVSTETHHADPTGKQARKVLRAMGISEPPAPPARDASPNPIPEGFSHRDLVNTYVWTAQGGFFAETIQATDAVTETHTGSYSFKATLSAAYEVGFEIKGKGATFGLEASFAGGTSVTRAKSKDASRGFGLTVECAPSGDLQRYDNGKPVFNAQGKPVLVPGKVDAYRFLTFYLGESSANFDDFYNKVVDPMWLTNSSEANAAALRQARQSVAKPPCWRVMHRVTYISRVLPPVPPPGAPPLEKAIRAENIDSNYELIQRLDPYVRTSAIRASDLAVATRAALAARLPELLPHADDIIAYLAQYYGLDL